MNDANSLRLKQMRHNAKRLVHKRALRLHPEHAEYTRVVVAGEKPKPKREQKKPKGFFSRLMDEFTYRRPMARPRGGI